MLTVLQRTVRRTVHMATASCMRTRMKSRPILSGMPAFSSERVTSREGLANTSCVPRALFSLIQSCSQLGHQGQTSSRPWAGFKGWALGDLL